MIVVFIGGISIECDTVSSVLYYTFFLTRSFTFTGKVPTDRHENLWLDCSWLLDHLIRLVGIRDRLVHWDRLLDSG